MMYARNKEVRKPSDDEENILGKKMLGMEEANVGKYPINFGRTTVIH